MSHKLDITTYNEKLAEYFLNNNVKVVILHSFDDVNCYEIRLRGRAQCRLVKEEGFADLAALNAMDAFRVVGRRLAPPVYTFKVGDQFALSRASDEVDFASLSHDQELLKTSIGAQDATIVPLNTLVEIDEFLRGAEEAGAAEVRFLLGFGQYSRVPYQEKYPIKTLRQLLLMTAKPTLHDAPIPETAKAE